MRHKDEGKREAICSATIELVTTNGFADTSISKIARAANVSPATIYVYYENKEDLLNQTYLMVKRGISEAMLEGFDESIPLKDGFKLIWENSYRYMLAQPMRFAFSEQFANSPLVNCVSEEEVSSYYQTIVNLFERGIQEGVIKDIPLEISAAFFLAPMMFLVKTGKDGELHSIEETLGSAFDIAWDALTI